VREKKKVGEQKRLMKKESEKIGGKEKKHWGKKKRE